MKSILQYILQRLFGFKRYLWFFTLYKLRVLDKDQSESDFFHFLSLLTKSGTSLDIGANLGLMSYHMCKTSLKVHAFEPIPQNLANLQKLKKKKSLNNLIIHPFALGNESGEIELILPVVSGVKKQGLSHVNHEKMEEFKEGESYISRIEKLDDLRFLAEQKIEGIKMDVENFEFEVLQGAEQLLKRDKPLVYTELWDNQNRKDCFEFMTALGYSIMVLQGDCLVHNSESESQTQNFFFVSE